MKPGTIARAFGLRSNRNHAAAVMAALKLLAGSCPQYAARLDPAEPDELRDTLEAWAVATDGYAPETVIEAARRMVRRMAAETRDYAPSASRLVAFCREISAEVKPFDPERAIERDLASPDAIREILSRSKVGAVFAPQREEGEG